MKILKSGKRKAESGKGAVTAANAAAVKGNAVQIWDSATPELMHKHGFSKHGNSRFYLSIGEGHDRNYVDKAWDRRCDASRWAKRAGAREVSHWYLC